MIKVEIKEVKKQEQEPKWSSICLVVSKYNDTYVLTTGVHGTDSFTGIDLTRSEFDQYNTGSFKKDSFILSDKGVTISNK